MHPVAVLLGGVLGTSVRLLLGGGPTPTGWDPSIIVVTVAGAFGLGMFLRLPVRPPVRRQVVWGILGTLVSFSAVALAQYGGALTGAAWAALLGIVAFGVVAAAIGMLLGHLMAAADEIG